nr:MAG TPA: hypothetical protein [Microviridae sp.]
MKYCKSKLKIVYIIPVINKYCLSLLSKSVT